ncbi:serine/threonine-protein kinase [Streptomyces albireticuli]|uniref:Serine/threonine protein kinase n=1 Tax=Streptomyces albireticuli TaxID=1940 RepID=A0A2A2DG58_9ACTN|nr:serine/threonine-protein kinase [Streptomyces albireticuli]MCD9145307.1 serine/threonine-protein kinase [Streptomyces albireticuli]MCD9164518.1 serine/threonine-protein kinase [Streptomyces albireticuli]MCD9194783.1 serine/threonine-protein kinase [Streptomyces albireticuli]PAU50389.1 serine/threonine protein kinase [Streptomyces albireticuli]
MPPLRRTGADPEAEDPGYAGQYRLEGRLGSGGMGVVHLARSASGLRLAVKVVHAEYAVDPEFRARFRQEVAAARLVSGAFTAPVVDADPDGVRPWMATLYIPGPTLSERVKRSGPLGGDEVRRLAAGLAEALRDIHRAGVVHRDLKPSNVLLAEDGPKVIDFGISRPYDSELRTETGKLIGTPPFMAPEQFQRPREVGPAADVFALASLLVHAATGRGPFESESPYIVAYQVVHNEPDLTGVPEDLVPLIRACLAKDPGERPTPDAIMARLPHAGNGDAGSVRGADTFPHTSLLSPGSPAPRDSERTHVRAATAARPDAVPGPAPATGRSRRRRAPWIVAAAVVLSALAGGGYWLLRGTDDPDRPLQTRPTAAGADWKPWATSVPGDASGDGRVRAGFCAYGEAALYCSAPGVQAARIDAAGGQVVWRRPVEDGKPGRGAAPAGTERSGGLAPPAPVVSGGLVHVTTPDGSRLTALDPATGEPRWTRNVSVYGGRVYHAGDTVLLVSADGTVTAVDGATDRQLWSHRLPGHAKPVFSSYGGGTAYAVSPAGAGGGHRTQVLALDARRGTTLWQRTADGDLTTVGVGPRDALYLTAADSDNRVSAVVRYDPADRSERRVPLGTPLNATSAVAYGDAVYLLSTDGGLTAVGTTAEAAKEMKGAKGPGQLWRLDTAVANGSALVATDRRLYFSAADGRLLAVDAGRGALLGQTAPRLTKAGRGYLDLLPAPVAADGKVFGAAPDGTVFAVSDHDPAGWR